MPESKLSRCVLKLSKSHTTIYLKRELTSGGENVRSNPERCQICRQLLHHMCCSCLALSIREPSRHVPVETSNTAGGNNLTLLLQVSFLIPSI